MDELMVMFGNDTDQGASEEIHVWYSISSEVWSRRQLYSMYSQKSEEKDYELNVICGRGGYAIDGRGYIDIIDETSANPWSDNPAWKLIKGGYTWNTENLTEIVNII